MLLQILNGLGFLIVFDFGRNDAILCAVISTQTALSQVGAVVGADILCGLDAYFHLFTNIADVTTETGQMQGPVFTRGAES